MNEREIERLNTDEIAELKADRDFLKVRNVWIANKLRHMDVSNKKNEEIRREILYDLDADYECGWGERRVEKC